MTFLGAVRVRNEEHPCIIGVTDSLETYVQGSRVGHGRIKIETMGPYAVMYTGLVGEVDEAMRPLRMGLWKRAHPTRVLEKQLSSYTEHRSRNAPFFLVLDGSALDYWCEIESESPPRVAIIQPKYTVATHGIRMDQALQSTHQLKKSLGGNPRTIAEGLLWVYHMGKTAAQAVGVDDNFQFVIVSGQGASALYPASVIHDNEFDIDGYVEETFGLRFKDPAVLKPAKQVLQSEQRMWFREQFVQASTMLNVALTNAYERWKELCDAQKIQKSNPSLKNQYALGLKLQGFQNRMHVVESMGRSLMGKDIISIQTEGISLVNGEHDLYLGRSHS